MSEFEPPQSRKPDSSKFREGKFTYHQEIEVEIASLTNLGEGVARAALSTSAAPLTPRRAT